MSKHIKRLIALITVITIAVTMFYCVNVSAESTVWTPTKGTPILTDIEDNYTYIRVNASASARTNEKYNFEENVLYIRNLSLPENKYWGCLTFAADENKTTGNTSKPEEGFLALLIKGNDADTQKYQLFFWNGSAQIELGNINRSDNLFVRFVKIGSGYGLQVNERLIKHDYITKFCNGEYHKKACLASYAYDYMGGDVKILKPFWNVDNNLKEPSVYKTDEDVYSIVSNGEGGKVYTNSKLDLDTKAVHFSNLNLTSGNSLTLNFDFDDAKQSKADLSLKIEATNDLFNIYFGQTLIGDIVKTDNIKISLSKKGSNYCLVFNGKILDLGNKLNNLFNNDRKVYTSVVVPEDFSTNITFTELLWVQYAGMGNAVVSLNDNNTNHIEVAAGQNVRASGKYDIFTTGVTLSNLDIPNSNSEGKGAFLYFGKTLDKNAPCTADDDAISLLIEKEADGIAFSLINSNGVKGLIGTVAKADVYNISFSLIQKSLTLNVNGTEFKLDKLIGENSSLAGQDIIAFLGTDEKNMVYIAFSATDYAKTDIDLFSFIKPTTPVGVTLYSDGTALAAKGDDKNGYNAQSKTEAYMITNLVWDHSVYALDTRLKAVNGALYFALSKTDVSDTNFWVCGSGDKVNRFGFVITPVENNTKAQLSYFGADGATSIETVIDVIDFDWTARHSYGVRLSDDGNWYLYVDGEAINKVACNTLNKFMQTNINEELFFILGSKKAIDVSLFKLIEHPVLIAEDNDEGWSAYTGKTAQLVKDENSNNYTFTPSKKSAQYSFRNGTEDITKTSLKIKINSVTAIGGKSDIYFAVSATDISDKKFTPSGAVDTVNRLVFYMKPDFENKTLTVSSYNDDGKGTETKIAVINDFDFAVAHTFDLRLCSDNNWYLCVDNAVLKNAKLSLLQDFMEKYSTKALYYGIGCKGYMDANELSIVPQANADVYISVETWHQVSNNRTPMEGNDIDGYSVHKDVQTFAYTDLKYDPTTTALSLKITDVAGWAYFSVVTCDYNDMSRLPVGTGDTVKRAILLIVPAGDSAQFQYWCADGKSSSPTVITTYKFDWFEKEHTFDVRQSEDDGNWYFCVDGKLLMNKISTTLNQFMKANAGENLRYCFGGYGCLGIENAKVVAKPPLKGSEDGDSAYEDGDYEEYEDFGFEFNFDNVDQEFELETEEVKEEIDPLDYLNKVKVKKRRLVSAAHGIIFTKLEIAGMIAGGIAVLGAVTFLTIFLVKKRKKKKAVK